MVTNIIHVRVLLKKIARSQKVLMGFIEHARTRGTCCVQSRAKLVTKSHFTLQYRHNKEVWCPVRPQNYAEDECPGSRHSRTSLSLCHEERITMTVIRIKDRDTGAHTRAPTIRPCSGCACSSVSPANSQRTRGREWPRWTRNPWWRHLCRQILVWETASILRRRASTAYWTSRLFFYY